MPVGGLGLLGSVIGGAFGGTSSYGTTAAPKPTALFPNQQNQYLSALFGANGSGGLFSTGASTLGAMAANGMPTDVGPAWDALKAAGARSVGEGRANLTEAYGAMGARAGKGMLTALGDYESQTNKDFLSILSNYTLQAQESARNRQMGAASTIMGMSQDIGSAMTPSAYVTQQPSTMSQIGGGLSGAGNYMQMMMLMNMLGGNNYKMSF